MSDERSIVDRLLGSAYGSEEDDPRAAQFMRGLVLGALVGAAIAGSTVLQRKQARRSKAAAAAGPDPDAPQRPDQG